MTDAPGARRLPTRCPVCKGAVIQRMSGSTQGTAIWFQCLFCKHMWKFRLDDPYEDANGELTGEVFIATEDGITCKLGLVAVAVIAEDAFQKHLDNKTRQGELERQTLQHDIDRLSVRLRTAEAEEDQLWKVLQRDEANSQHAHAWSLAYNHTRKLTNELEVLKGQRNHLTSGEYFFEGLPSAIATATTDSDGKFTLVVPRQGRFAVVARGSPETLTEKDTVFWFLWVSLDGQPSQRVVLSNDNIAGAGSADSALR
jgi:hypothetical protein